MASIVPRKDPVFGVLMPAMEDIARDCQRGQSEDQTRRGRMRYTGLGFLRICQPNWCILPMVPAADQSGKNGWDETEVYGLRKGIFILHGNGDKISAGSCF
ncbi:hypothetical protein [Pedobacter rhizosphaerae]|uniref:Uncharacterized protein n=1 Tax=Pedobacter rhizosphaerae TaxID=390241 RepID=A0A1H9VPI6_9SPHI|nr:hypothetical protein [Pedobacter rhizosphaerae]SES23479.1 hypothetical protein SAMN04488023_14620 [Pedobacter rhizosphaerae]